MTLPEFKAGMNQVVRAIPAALNKLSSEIKKAIAATMEVQHSLVDPDADLREEQEARKWIAYSCGFCGAPLNKYKEHVDAPEGYDADAFPHDACGICQASEESWERQYVTREMALDAGDPTLEGSIW